MNEVNDDASERVRTERLMRLAQLAYKTALAGYLGNNYTQSRLIRQPYRIPQQTGYEWVMENLGHRRSCYKMFRMNLDVFTSLHTLLVSHYGLESTRDVTSVESLAMFLWIVGAPQSFSQVEVIFSRSTEKIHKKFKHVLKCLCKLASQNIRPRDTSFMIMHDKIREDRFWLHFKGAIGAIDGSHIRVEVPTEEVVNHTGRHRFTSQNVMAICDFDMRFTFIVTGCPGSAHDTRILNDSLVKYADRFPTPPAGTYFIY